MKLDKQKRTLIGIGLITAGVIGLWALHSSQKNKPREIFEKVIKKLQQDIPPIMSELPITEKISREFLTYENDKYGIEVKYPKNWTKIWEEKKQFGGVTNIITFVAPRRYSGDTDPESVSVSTYSVLEGITLERITLEQEVETILENIKKVGTITKIVDSNETVLAGLPARQAIFEFDYGGTYKQIQIHVRKGQQSYVLLYVANKSDYQKYLGQVKDIFNSFRFISK